MILSQHYFPSLRDGKYNLRTLWYRNVLNFSTVVTSAPLPICLKTSSVRGQLGLQRKSYYQSGLDWWQSLLPVRKCLDILRPQAAHAHCSQYMRIVDNTAAVMFENDNIILVYSPLVDRLGLGPCLVGRLGFSSMG